MAIAIRIPGSRSDAAIDARAARTASSPVVRAPPKTAITRRPSVRNVAAPCSATMASKAPRSASCGDDGKPAKTAVSTRRSHVDDIAATRVVGSSGRLTLMGSGLSDGVHGAIAASPSASSCIEGNRSSGALFIARRTSASSSIGTPGSTSRSRGASERTIFASTANTSSPAKARRPESSSKSTAPSAN